MTPMTRRKDTRHPCRDCPPQLTLSRTRLCRCTSQESQPNVCRKEWTVAIQEEYDSLMKNCAWELVDLPPGKNPITYKWDFKAKDDANGNNTRFNARLVARGFSQAYGIDYFNTFAPIAKLTTYHMIFAPTALEKWVIHGMDVITAYLLNKLNEMYSTWCNLKVLRGWR